LNQTRITKLEADIATAKTAGTDVTAATTALTKAKTALTAVTPSIDAAKTAIAAVPDTGTITEAQKTAEGKAVRDAVSTFTKARVAVAELARAVRALTPPPATPTTTTP
jgi:hypothetical protein